MRWFCVPGADVVDWLYSRVEGFKDRRDARKYASSLLKHGYLRHTVNKITFSEQCYYTFGDLCQSTAAPPRLCVFPKAANIALNLFASVLFCHVFHLLQNRHGFAEFERGLQRRRLRAGHSGSAPSDQQPLAHGRAAFPLPSLPLSAP